MANRCEFVMKISGKKENIRTFCKWMTQNEDIWIGRGAEICYPLENEMDDCFEGESDDCKIRLEGDVKWSLNAALIRDAISMREHPEEWSKDLVKKEYLTLFEACKKLNLSMEAYSQEPSCGFQEHLLFIDDSVKVNKKVKWFEVYDPDKDVYFSEGGFSKWKFKI